MSSATVQKGKEGGSKGWKEEEQGKDQWYLGWHQCDGKHSRFQEESMREMMEVGFSVLLI